MKSMPQLVRPPNFPIHPKRAKETSTCEVIKKEFPWVKYMAMAQQPNEMTGNCSICAVVRSSAAVGGWVVWQLETVENWEKEMFK